MADTWDDGSDDEWDVGSDDDVIDARLGLKKLSTDAPVFDDEEDLAVTERARQAQAQHSELKKKGNALAAKKKAEQDRIEEEELARKAMELEAEMEANMSAEEKRALERRRIEEADNALTDDLFGGVDAPAAGPVAGGGKAVQAGDTVELNDLKDHLKHARKVAQCIKVCVNNSSNMVGRYTIDSFLALLCNCLYLLSFRATARSISPWPF